jgi:hypothetical protein
MRPSLHAADGAIILMESATMPTVCLRFRFEEHPKIRARMEAWHRHPAAGRRLRPGKRQNRHLHPHPSPLPLPARAASGSPLQLHLRGDPIRRPGRPRLPKPAAEGEDPGGPAGDPAALDRSGPADGEDRMGRRDPDRYDPGGRPGSEARRPYLSPSPQVSPAAG